MNHAGELLRALEELDLRTLRRLWAHVAPHLPQPSGEWDALCTAHHARTQTISLGFRLRAYSHAWLIDHGLPSGLPDNLRPHAERIYPVTAMSVGIAMATDHGWLREPILIVRGAMEDAVKEVYADGRSRDIPLLKRRMLEARDYMRKKLFGPGRWMPGTKA